MDISKLSKEKRAVVSDALAAGYIAEHTDCSLDLLRYSKHKKPRVLQGLRIYPDGSGYNYLVKLADAKTIRSANGWRETLDLPKPQDN